MCLYLYMCGCRCVYIYTVSTFFFNIRNSGTCTSSTSHNKNFEPGTNPYLFYPVVRGWKARDTPILCYPLAPFPSGLIRLCRGWMMHTWAMQRQPKRDGWDALCTSVFLTRFQALLFLMPYLHSNLTENEQPICTSSFFHEPVCCRERERERLWWREKRNKAWKQAIFFQIWTNTVRKPYLYLSTWII